MARSQSTPLLKVYTFSHRKSMGESDHLPKVHTTKVYEVDWDSPKQVESVRCCQPVPEKAKLQENIYNKYEYVSYLLRRLTLIHWKTSFTLHLTEKDKSALASTSLASASHSKKDIRPLWRRINGCSRNELDRLHEGTNSLFGNVTWTTRRNLSVWN